VSDSWILYWLDDFFLIDGVLCEYVDLCNEYCRVFFEDLELGFLVVVLGFCNLFDELIDLCFVEIVEFSGW